jgi:hypothetical protein
MTQAAKRQSAQLAPGLKDEVQKREFSLNLLVWMPGNTKKR